MLPGLRPHCQWSKKPLKLWRSTALSWKYKNVIHAHLFGHRVSVVAAGNRLSPRIMERAKTLRSSASEVVLGCRCLWLAKCSKEHRILDSQTSQRQTRPHWTCLCEGNNTESWANCSLIVHSMFNGISPSISLNKPKRLILHCCNSKWVNTNCNCSWQCYGE